MCIYKNSWEGKQFSINVWYFNN